MPFRGLIILLFLSAVWSQYGYTQRTINYKSGYMEGFKKDGAEIRKLADHVEFYDSTTTMYCDSAYFYENEDIDAYGSIRIIPRSGSTSLIGDLMHYKAGDRTATLTGNVVLVDDSATLTTHSIVYSLNTGVAHYPERGTIVNGTDHIVSDLGSYDRNTKMAYFKRNVVVTNPQGVVKTDTMNYSTSLKTAYFLGPTTMVGKANDSVYCEQGWYNTTTGRTLLRKHAWMKSKERTIRSDSLYYDKITGLGRAYSHITITDTSQNIIICGDYAQYNRPEQTAMVTKRALMIQVDNSDSLYLHADTIRSGIFVVSSDTLHSDTTASSGTPPDTFKYIKAYHHVKFFRKDLQGKCDSMYYSFKDSVLDLYREPVLWTGDNQLTAGHVRLLTHNQRINKMVMTNTAFMISKVDTNRYQQIKGRKMTGYFNKDNELYRIFVEGNGQTIYFAYDNHILMGIKKTESSEVSILLKDRKAKRITFINSVSGTFYPPDELKGNDLILKNFMWLERLRPLRPEDVFVWKNEGGDRKTP